MNSEALQAIEIQMEMFQAQISASFTQLREIVNKQLQESENNMQIQLLQLKKTIIGSVSENLNQQDEAIGLNEDTNSETDSGEEIVINNKPPPYSSSFERKRRPSRSHSRLGFLRKSAGQEQNSSAPNVNSSSAKRIIGATIFASTNEIILRQERNSPKKYKNSFHGLDKFKKI